ncbi:hypothetical protein LAZ29_00835 [Cereibacter sphaeroides]|nr:hypothetical protein [Cereibacter sphaeroides]
MPHPASAEELAAALPDILAAPKTDAPVASLGGRAGFGERSFPGRLLFTRGCGIPGERWRKHPWLRLPDGAPGAWIQVSILPARVCDLVWRDRGGTLHSGDRIVADLDTTEANLPAGSLLQAARRFCACRTCSTTAA